MSSYTFNFEINTQFILYSFNNSACMQTNWHRISAIVVAVVKVLELLLTVVPVVVEVVVMVPTYTVRNPPYCEIKLSTFPQILYFSTILRYFT